jgi:hypothetical protein
MSGACSTYARRNLVEKCQANRLNRKAVRPIWKDNKTRNFKKNSQVCFPIRYLHIPHSVILLLLLLLLHFIIMKV